MVAVLAVVVQHATHQGPVSHPELGPAPFTFSVQAGAATLLVISAFFVCCTVRRDRPLRWWWNRVSRLLPPYLVAVVLTYLLVVLVAVPDWYRPTTGDLVGNLLLAQAWWPDVHYVDGSYWTLPVQLLAFTSAAVLWPIRWMRGWRAPLTLWALVVVPMALRLLWRTDDASQLVRSVYDGLGLYRAHLFAAGVGIWLWSRRRLRGWHLSALVGAVLVGHEVQTDDRPSTVAVGVVLGLVCLAAAGPDWPFARFLGRPVAFLSGISYGVYLLNQEIGYLVARVLLDHGVGPWSRLAATVATAVLLGWLLTALVERPAHRWLTGRVGDRLAHAGRAVGLRAGWGIRLALALRLRWALRISAGLGRLPTASRPGDQIQGGSSGSSPASAIPSPRPVSQASTLAARPLIEVGVPLAEGASSHTR
ncbi:Peptidoglycan/LPS O-acetylase OafA/YrhL, contains acyltransferase and SGNH-hydrolase domains [Streptoalloteichus hindustanus]|uniref:Peptidoglycan/LPS O-acetylase OafA/YrhL, contains acyltransferase and SGNH-hydrolase domains n=1 Tax=Streptoalloteichus hindustanus TaxID=2017 RepID=A0A1M5HHB8_STRHI|nr:Peptidoglycan/LPS O-acetylase OafA/YrhL, contains acyltransferase and SGNH-hydrolase domains [Streptoalloteichus hindustanus]